MPQTPHFPYEDGDVTVLGPEVFATKDGAVISWKGENYVRHTDQDRAPHDLTSDAVYELASSVRDLASAIRLERADRTITVSVDDSVNPADIASQVTSTLRKMRRRPEGGA
jgi:hypothetical protein